MATVQEIVEALDTYIEGSSGLQITCIKGYPDFRRDNVTPPIAALFYGGSSQGQDVPKAVGRPMKTLVLTLGVFASNEVNLFVLMQRLGSMRSKRPFTVTAGDDAQQVKVYVGDDERTPPDSEDPKELRHFVTCPVVVAYE